MASLEAYYVYQGVFFVHLSETSPIVIGDLIRLHVQQADAKGSSHSEAHLDELREAGGYLLLFVLLVVLLWHFPACLLP